VMIRFIGVLSIQPNMPIIRFSDHQITRSRAITRSSSLLCVSRGDDSVYPCSFNTA
jgi:hypothetical protein